MRKALIVLVSIALVFGILRPGVEATSKKPRATKKPARQAQVSGTRVLGTPVARATFGVDLERIPPALSLTHTQRQTPSRVQTGASSAAASATAGLNREARTGGQAPDQPTTAVDAVPILMYHEIGDNPSQLYVSRENFEAQMKFLKESGFHTVTLDQVYRHFQSGEALPPKPVALTFDDGYRTVYTAVYPIFQKYGFTGTFFVFTDGIDRPRYATWDQLKEMSRAGQSIQSHTRSHPRLTTRSSEPAWLKDQLDGSKAILEEKLGKKVQFLAYPGGYYDPVVVEATRESGFLAAVTVEEGWASALDGPYSWKRIRVFRRETVSSLAYKLGSPNYAGAPRIKKVRRNVVTE